MFVENEHLNATYRGLNPDFAKRVRARRAAEARLAEKLEAERMAAKRAAITLMARQGLDKTARTVIATVAERHGVSLGDIFGPSKRRVASKARHAAYRAVADEFPSKSLKWIARQFGRADHSTVHHSLRKTRKEGQAR